mmetsp:Transcript_5522/g.10366  ORF Transcript_5522/g.10366 Transcript_5522/m.10366 type:complete len:223 (-) Transcript_5522:99-767(-)
MYCHCAGCVPSESAGALRSNGFETRFHLHSLSFLASQLRSFHYHYCRRRRRHHPYQASNFSRRRRLCLCVSLLDAHCGPRRHYQCLVVPCGPSNRQSPICIGVNALLPRNRCRRCWSRSLLRLPLRRLLHPPHLCAGAPLGYCGSDSVFWPTPPQPWIPIGECHEGIRYQRPPNAVFLRLGHHDPQGEHRSPIRAWRDLGDGRRSAGGSIGGQWIQTSGLHQ